VPVATRYREQDRLKDGPNAAWENHLNTLVQPVVDRGALTNVTEAERALALRERASRRAFDGAPPTIPHSTLMRTDCLSCHGPQGLYGLRTPHPERQSCLQCHAPGAHLDQYQFLSAGPTP
jgi:nitrate reductase (cytochrome), electron transfer subunit